MAGPKRTKTEREAALAEVARLDGRGCSQREIAERLKVTQQQVSYDLKKIRERYAHATLDSRHVLVVEKLAQYRELRAEAWSAFERSKADKERKSTESIKSTGGRGRGLGAETKKLRAQSEQRLPANEYLRTVLECLEAERKLTGADSPTKIAPTNPEGDDEYRAGLTDAERLSALSQICSRLGCELDPALAEQLRRGIGGEAVEQAGPADEAGGDDPRRMADERPECGGADAVVLQ